MKQENPPAGNRTGHIARSVTCLGGGVLQSWLGGGTPVLAGGGTPRPDQWGTPVLAGGGTPRPDQWGAPVLAGRGGGYSSTVLAWGYPSPGGGVTQSWYHCLGVPPEGTWDQRLGYTPEGHGSRDWDTPCQKGPGTRIWERDWEPDWASTSPPSVILLRMRAVMTSLLRISFDFY